MEKNYEFRTFIKRNALFKLTEAIRYTDCSLERFKKFISEYLEYFTADEWEEIRSLVDELLNSKERFAFYCRNNNL